MLGAFKHAAGEEAMLQDREQCFEGVQLRTAGRRPEQEDIGGDLQFPRPVPARSVEDDEGMLARGNLLSDLPEMAVRSTVSAFAQTCPTAVPVSGQVAENRQTYP